MGLHASVVDSEDDSSEVVACDHAGHGAVVDTCKEVEDSLLVPLAVGGAGLGQVVVGMGKGVQVQMVSEDRVGAPEAGGRRVVDGAMPSPGCRVHLAIVVAPSVVD